MVRRCVRPVRLLALLVAGASIACGGSRASSDERVQLSIRGVSILAELAHDFDARARGLSGRQTLPPGEGMLFLFSRPERHAFWMQGMRFDLDLVWIRGERIVDLSPEVSHLDPERIHRPREPADRVLEVRAGTAGTHGWRVGDRVHFARPLPRAGR